MNLDNKTLENIESLLNAYKRDLRDFHFASSTLHKTALLSLMVIPELLEGCRNANRLETEKKDNQRIAQAGLVQSIAYRMYQACKSVPRFIRLQMLRGYSWAKGIQRRPYRIDHKSEDGIHDLGQLH